MKGKKAADLQTGIVVTENAITGTLKHVTGYTGYSPTPTEQTGNFIALKIDVKPSDVVTTVEVVGGTKGPVKLETDGVFIGQIKNKDTETIKVECKHEGKTLTKTYSLTGLTLNKA